MFVSAEVYSTEKTRKNKKNNKKKTKKNTYTCCSLEHITGCYLYSTVDVYGLCNS